MMTGLLHEREFSRKSFVKGGGALVVGFSIAGSTLAGKASAAGVDPFDSYGPGDPNQVDSYLTINSDNTALIKTGRVNLGQGSPTGLLILAAEELDMSIDQLEFARNDTNLTPDTALTAGSSSIRKVGPILRAASAAAKQALLTMASAQLGVPVSGLSVSNGVVSGGGKSVTYGELVGGKLLNVEMPASWDMQKATGFGVFSFTGGLNPGQAPAKPISSYKLVGTFGIPRIDIPAKVTGSYTYVQNIRVPGMLHGRIVRPRGQGAYGDGTAPAILSIDKSSVAHIPNVQILQRNNFLGVVAPHEWDAIQAAAQLKVKWAPMPPISSSGNMWGQMRAFDAAGQAPASIQASSGNVDEALASAAKTVSGSYAYHYNGHMCLGPACAVADVTPAGAVVMANTQGCYQVRDKLAMELGLPKDKIRVVYYEGASSYGNSPARYDASQAAAVMSQLAGKPVRVQYMRWDEHGWDNYGPAQLMDVQGGVDAQGNITAFEYTVYAIPQISQTLDDPTMQQIGLPLPKHPPAGADTTNTGTQYNIANRRIVAKSLPLVNNYFKTSSLRAPQAPQTCFASEQLIDELAYAAGMDPYEFRLKNITTAKVNDGYNQWRDALVEVAKLANWQPRVANSVQQTGNVVTGHGIAIGGFANSQAGVAVEIQVNKRSGKITLQNAYASQVNGLSVYPDGIMNQLSGNLIMGASRALFEEVVFNRAQVTSLDWVSYPIMRFADSPNVKYAFVTRNDLVPTGSGEPPEAPMAAAIANAFFDATGVRIREAPMTPARVRAVLKAAGVA